jgi:hypothetical protein
MRVLRRLWQAWKRFGQFIGDLVARLVLTLFYFTLFVPFGIGVTWFSDPLQVRHRAPKGWRPRHDAAHAAPPSIEDARRQF